MATLFVGFLYEYLLLLVFFGSAAGTELPNSVPSRQPKIFYSARNRALKNFVYIEKNVSSAVLCGRECSMYGQCTSINFYKQNSLCQMNYAARHGHVGFFEEEQGSIYFDGYEDTGLFSLADEVVRYQSCRELCDAGFATSGVFAIDPAGLGDAGLDVYCDRGWAVFQRYRDGAVDFHRDATEYQAGFGNLSGEFWLGTDNLLQLTSQGEWDLRIDLGDSQNNTVWAKYTDFTITAQTDDPAAVFYFPDQDFYNMDFESQVGAMHSAQDFLGARRFANCANLHLHGLFNTSSNASLYWYHWQTAFYSLTSFEMKIRPRDI